MHNHLGDVEGFVETQPFWETLGDSCHWHGCGLSEMTSPHILSICYLLTFTSGGCVGWCLLVSRTCLSWLALGLCQSGSPGTSSHLLPIQSSKQLPAHFQGALWAGPLPCTTAHSSVCSRAELGSPKVSPAAVLRERAGLAGQPTRLGWCSAPQNSLGWLVERSGR